MARMQRIILLFAVLFWVFVFFSRELYASMVYVPNSYGLTARGIALVNALTADNQELSGAYYNPASLAGVQTNAFSAGYIHTFPYFFGGIKDGTRVRQETNNEVVNISCRLNIRKFFSEKLNVPPIGFGFSVTVDDYFRTMMVFDDARDHNGTFDRYGMSSLSLQGGFGIGVTDWMSIGIGFHGGFLGTGTVETRADVNGSTANEGTHMRGSMRPRPLAGIRFHQPGWAIGVNYRDETLGSFEPIDVTATPSLEGLDISTMEIPMNFLDTFVPRDVSAGLTWDITPAVKLLSDFSWRNWNRYDKVAAQSQYVGSLSSFDTVDIWTPRVATEIKPTEQVTVRAGYRYEQTPFRKIGTRYPMGGTETLGKVILDNDSHIGSIGGGYSFDSHKTLAIVMNIDWAYQFHYLVPREAKTSDGYTYESQGVLHLLTTSVGFDFR